MPTQFFTNNDDTYTVTAAGDYSLIFLGGNDTLNVRGGTTTTASMGEGDDLVRLYSGLATVYLEDGNDRAEIWAPGATVYGGGDDDLINLRAGSDQTVYGDAGTDRINFYGDVTNVTAHGGGNNDKFYGYGHTITGSIYGDVGDDQFYGFTGNAGLTIYGGGGNDLYRADATNPANFVELPGGGVDSVQVARGINYTLGDNFENISVQTFTGGTTGAATLTGNVLSNIIHGGANDETIFGLDGNDRLAGYGGNDTLHGGMGSDVLDGGVGNDTLYGDEGADTLNGRAGDDYMAGGIGSDTYYVDSAGDQVVENPGEGTDTERTTISLTLATNVENGIILGSAGLQLDGNVQANQLSGGTGDDTLNGWAGNDTLKGGAGNDTLNGGDNNDRLYGGSGADTLTGGNGSDHFMFTSELDSIPGSADTITDFTANGSGTADVIDLTAIDANTAMAGDQAFTWNSTNPGANALWWSVTDNGDGTSEVTYYGDVNGDSVADFQLNVHQIGSVTVGTDVLL